MLEKTNQLEWDLLCQCCIAAISENKFKIKEGIDWQQLWLLTAKHKVRVSLYEGLKKSLNPSLIPNAFINNLKQINRRIANNNLQQTQELIQLNNAFIAAGITVVFYKGSILAAEAYKNLKAREYSDMDLLVDTIDFPKIQTLLEARNYQAESQVPYSFFKKFSDQYYEYNFDYYENGQRRYHVEPHWTLGPKRYQIAFSLKDFSSFIIQKRIFGRTINTFTPEGKLLSICLHHGGQDNWSSLKQISDVAAIIKQFGTQINWQVLLDTARKWRVLNLLLLGLALAQSILETPLPALVQQQLGNPKVLRQHKKVIIKLKAKDEHQKDISIILNRLKFHLTLRASIITKLKILYYHFLQIIIPNDTDVVGKNLNEINYFWLSLSKQIRLIKSYLLP